jgi:hypothetical protein
MDASGARRGYKRCELAKCRDAAEAALERRARQLPAGGGTGAPRAWAGQICFLSACSVPWPCSLRVAAGGQRLTQSPIHDLQAACPERQHSPSKTPAWSLRRMTLSWQ